MPDRQTLYLIDGHAQIFRAYHAISSLSSPVTGEPTNATFGFVGMLLRLLREFAPDYVIVTIDVSGDQGTFRSQLDPDYKANRDAPPEDLHPQVERIVQLCGLFNIPVLGLEGVEADDVIASVCTQLADRDDLLTRIVSRDKDLQQLLSDRVEMFDIHKDQTIDVAALMETKGVTPDQVIDLLALMGDNADNIPGVHGVGEKTAAKWIAQYGSIESLLEHLDELTPKKRESVEAARDRLSLNRELVTLKTDLDTGLDLDAAAVSTPDVAALADEFKQLGFTRHLQDLHALTGLAAPAEPEKPAAKKTPHDEGGLFGHLDDTPPESSIYDHANPDDYQLITTQSQLDAFLADLRAHAAEGNPIAVDTETTSVSPMLAELCGLSLSLRPHSGVYIPTRSPEPDTHLDTDTVLAAMRPILEDPAIAKVGQNLKYDWVVLKHHGIDLQGVAFDTMIASFLIDSSRSSHKLDNLALACLNYEMIPIDQLIGKGKKQITFDKVPLDTALTYAAEDADITLRLREQFAPRLQQMGLVQLFDELEMPLVPVLAELEYNGIAVDADELETQRASMQKRVDTMRTEIIDTAGVDFNPDSPKQLADVLFNTLGCKPYKRTKTGPSTDSEVLERIVDEQQGVGAQLAGMVLEYRQLTKLVGTYLVALSGYVHPETGRIHTSFHQTVAATGRLASSDPNLQNIPIRTEEGRRIRKAFVAPPDHILLSADYSQIELRVLAHLSQDPALMKAFQDDQDIHRAVAAEVFGVAPDEVTSDQRGAAKMVNFGIVYGITPYGLARRLHPGANEEHIAEAKAIIDNYKKRYPKIDRFLARCVETAQTKGYVETIMKRRRPIPQITSTRGNTQQLGQRMAINSVVQGSAADLIKLAMVQLHDRVHTDQLPMKMLLQIHDELVVEVPNDQADAMAELLRQTMEQAMSLTVPLRVDVNRGADWHAAK